MYVWEDISGPFQDSDDQCHLCKSHCVANCMVRPHARLRPSLASQGVMLRIISPAYVRELVMTRANNARRPNRPQNVSKGGAPFRSLRKPLGLTKDSNFMGLNNPPPENSEEAPGKSPKSPRNPAGRHANNDTDSRLDFAKYHKCLALADEADGITDSLFRLRQKLSRNGALGKMNSVRKIVGKSLRKLFHSMSMMKCKKYNIQPTVRDFQRDANGIPMADGRGEAMIHRTDRPVEDRAYNKHLDWKRGYKH